MDLKKKLIGDKAFYKMVLLVAVPIMVQQGITNFVSLLDNVMVGRIGTEQMSGVSIVNQLVFVFNLAIFGGFAGAGIFTAQYNGICDNDGIRQTVRYKFQLGLIISLFFCIVMTLFGDKLVGLYLNEGSDGDLVKTLEYALDYTRVILWTVPFFMIQQMFSSSLRECGETMLPMKAGVIAVFTNLAFNWILIFGNLGFPALGVVGAAIATLISRVVESAIVVIWTYRHKERFPFVEGLFKSIVVKKELFWRIFKTGTPLLMNELLWSMGMAVLTQCYSMRGLESVAAFNISNTVINVFKVVFLAMANAIGIIIGRLLGAGKMDEAVDTDSKMLAFSIFISTFVALLMISVSSLIPAIYNTTDSVRAIARSVIIVGAVFMPLDAYICGVYFTIRSGGRTWVTFLFDGAFTWIVSVPIAFALSRLTGMSSVMIFVFVNIGDLIKLVMGTILLRKRVWVRTIV